MSDTDIHFSSSQAVRLVAGREISTRLASKAFRITTIVMLVLLVGVAVATKLIKGSDKSVGVTSSAAALAGPLQASGKAIGETIDTPQVDEATGRQQVRDGDLDALVLSTADGKISVLVKKKIDSDVEKVLKVLAGQVALNQQISTLGGDPTQVAQAVASASVDVQSIEKPFDYNTQQLTLGIIAGILIYLSLMLNGQQVAQGVVEEKASRVVELLLSTIRPWQLMAGKVLGIGLVGLIQIVVLGGGGVIAALATGALTISVSAAVGTVVWLVVWYLLGFIAYALAFAAAGALVARQEDVGGVVTPVLMFVIIGYVLGISILPGDPGNKALEIMSVLPPFAPTLMPMRLAMGGVPAWEAGLAVVLMLAVIPGLVWLAGRIYQNAVIRTGARVHLRQALSKA